MMHKLNLDHAGSSYTYVARMGNQTLTEISGRRESSGEFSLEGKKYQVGRESGWGAYTLHADGEQLCAATKHNAFQDTFTLVVGDATYRMSRTSMWRGHYELVDESENRKVGVITAKGFFRNRGEIEFDDVLSLPVQMFVLWLVVLMWKREENAASSVPTVG